MHRLALTVRVPRDDRHGAVGREEHDTDEFGPQRRAGLAEQGQQTVVEVGLLVQRQRGTVDEVAPLEHAALVDVGTVRGEGEDHRHRGQWHQPRRDPTEEYGLDADGGAGDGHDGAIDERASEVPLRPAVRSEPDDDRDGERLELQSTSPAINAATAVWTAEMSLGR